MGKFFAVTIIVIAIASAIPILPPFLAGAAGRFLYMCCGLDGRSRPSAEAGISFLATAAFSRCCFEVFRTGPGGDAKVGWCQDKRLARG